MACGSHLWQIYTTCEKLLWSLIVKPIWGVFGGGPATVTIFKDPKQFLEGTPKEIYNKPSHLGGPLGPQLVSEGNILCFICELQVSLKFWHWCHVPHYCAALISSWYQSERHTYFIDCTAWLKESIVSTDLQCYKNQLYKLGYIITRINCIHRIFKVCHQKWYTDTNKCPARLKEI